MFPILPYYFSVVLNMQSNNVVTMLSIFIIYNLKVILFLLDLSHDLLLTDILFSVL